MSVLEVAHLPVGPEAGPEFEKAFATAKPLIDSADGALGSELTRSTTASGYVLIVRWRELGDHIEKFVASESFTRFQELLWPHFDGDPVVEHFAELEGGAE